MVLALAGDSTTTIFMQFQYVRAESPARKGRAWAAVVAAKGGYVNPPCQTGLPRDASMAARKLRQMGVFERPLQFRRASRRKYSPRVSRRHKRQCFADWVRFVTLGSFCAQL